jgi:hypothetical protein
MTTDPDEGCSRQQRQFRALYRAVERIWEVMPRALEDVNARGFPAGRGYDTLGGGMGDMTVVEGAALRPSPAIAWLAEANSVLRQVVTLGAPAGEPFPVSSLGTSRPPIIPPRSG